MSRHGIAEHLIDDYAKDVASRLFADRIKEAARLCVNFRNISNQEDYNLMLSKVKQKGISDYEFMQLYKELHRYRQGERSTTTD